MMDTFNVNISISSPEDQSDVIKITGAPAQVEKAEEALAEKVKKIDAEKADRVSIGTSLCYHYLKSQFQASISQFPSDTGHLTSHAVYKDPFMLGESVKVGVIC